MRPYIAILIDSFWEAVGNKVLWALLIGWTFILCGLFPFGYVTESSFRISSFDIQNKDRLIEKLAKGAKGQGPQDVRTVAQLLKPEFTKRLKEVDDKKAGERLDERDLAMALNDVIAAEDLYSEEVFPTAKRRQRLETLIDDFPAGLDKADLEQLNRELLQLVFPLELNQPRGEQLWIGYGGLKIGEPLAVSRRQINQFVEPILLSLIIKLGLGVVAIFVALVVTSPIIPETFRSSSLHLLLSKPISRVWLFLWKFFGATIFVLVNISFVLIGLYFIAGIRFDIWNAGLIGCIPLLMFVFVIFYSVSALAGLLWGNSIVCVVSCMVFWVFCFGIGVVHEFMRVPIRVNQQIVRIRPIEDHVFSVTSEGQLNVWNDQHDVWQPAIDSETQGTARTFGPFYDEQRQSLLVKSFFRSPFGDLQSRSRKLSLIRLGEQSPDAAATADADISAAETSVDLSSPETQEQTTAPESERSGPDAASADENAVDGSAGETDAGHVEATQGEASPGDATLPEATPPTDGTQPQGETLPNPFDSAAVDSGLGESIVDGAGEGSPVRGKRFVSTATSTQSADSAALDTPASDPTEKEADDEAATAPEDGSPNLPKTAAEARKEPRWIPEPGPELPQQLFDVLELEDGLLAISRNGLFWFPYSKLTQMEMLQGGLLNINLPFFKTNPFEDVTPAGYFTSNNTSASILADESGIVVYGAGTLNVLKFSSGRKLKLETSTDLAQLGLDGDGTEASLVAMNERFCVMARDEQPLAILTSELEKMSTVTLPGEAKVRQMTWVPESDIVSIVTHTGELYQLDCDTGVAALLSIPYQGECTCAYWLDDSRVWLGLEPNRAAVVNIADGSSETFFPKKTTFQMVFSLIVDPLYLANPKPAALDNAMSYLLTGDQTATTQLITNDLGAVQVELEIWQPIVSNLLFVAVVLGISCLYVARKEY